MATRVRTWLQQEHFPSYSAAAGQGPRLGEAESTEELCCSSHPGHRDLSILPMDKSLPQAWISSLKVQQVWWSVRKSIAQTGRKLLKSFSVTLRLQPEAVSLQDHHPWHGWSHAKGQNTKHTNTNFYSVMHGKGVIC